MGKHKTSRKLNNNAIYLSRFFVKPFRKSKKAFYFALNVKSLTVKEFGVL